MPAVTRSFHALGAAAVGVLLATAGPARAEVELPRLSPTASVSQQVGLTEIAVDYGSPAVRGRKVWGGMVPYDKPWTITTDQPTRLKLSRDARIGDKQVAAGTYVLQAIPSRTDWTIVLTKQGTSDSVQFKARTKPCSHRERLAFLFGDFTEEKASLDLEWEKLRVSIPISVNTGQQVAAGIADLDSAWRSYANAARYMLETKKDFEAGLRYADQSLALKEDWYTLWVKAALLAAKRDWRAARDNAEKAYQLGQKQGEGFTLERELRQNLADWTAKAQGENSNLSAR